MARLMKKNVWKILSVVLLVYVIIAGFLGPIPDLDIVHQTIRNLYFHVCMWFVMITMLSISVVNSIQYLARFNLEKDTVAKEASLIGIFFGMMGIVTGMIWAQFAWGTWWINDPKLNGAAVGLLVYFAYMVLRKSLDDPHKRARISAVYNIFAYVIFILFILVLPKLSGVSLHPGDGKESIMPVMSMDNSLRIVFYPAILGWILLACWILNLRIRYIKVKNKIDT
ncbi:MAG TPA: cytochrome c biogenesis protein CcsA [Bacteroidales bacterium]|nr:cytochrome c biogenesis protein CcsA [Bacteroidales bacterium]HQI45453.1 cytochrome c biogenesis protein CcsA [Bacteroidales bacterium]